MSDKIQFHSIEANDSVSSQPRRSEVSAPKVPREVLEAQHAAKEREAAGQPSDQERQKAIKAELDALDKGKERADGDRTPTGSEDEGQIPNEEQRLLIQRFMAEQVARDHQAQQDRQANETPEELREREHAYNKFWKYVEPQIINKIRDEMINADTFMEWIGSHRRGMPRYTWNEEMRKIYHQYPDVLEVISNRAVDCVVKTSKERGIGALVARGLQNRVEITDSGMPGPPNF